MSLPKAVIRNVASHLPATRLTNEELAAREGAYSAEQIYEKTGILERPTAADGECADATVAAGHVDRHRLVAAAAGAGAFPGPAQPGAFAGCRTGFEGH